MRRRADVSEFDALQVRRLVLPQLGRQFVRHGRSTVPGAPSAPGRAWTRAAVHGSRFDPVLVAQTCHSVFRASCPSNAAIAWEQCSAASVSSFSARAISASSRSALASYTRSWYLRKIASTEAAAFAAFRSPRPGFAHPGAPKSYLLIRAGVLGFQTVRVVTKVPR